MSWYVSLKVEDGKVEVTSVSGLANKNGSITVSGHEDETRHDTNVSISTSFKKS